MGVVTGIVLGVMVLYLIGYPILTDEEFDTVNYQKRITTLEEETELKKDYVLAELSELKLDYQLDKLSKKEYQRFEKRLKKLALDLIQENGTAKE